MLFFVKKPFGKYVLITKCILKLFCINQMKKKFFFAYSTFQNEHSEKKLY